ncbi:MAG: DsbA family protein [Haloarculaceae archaeon]
MRVSRRGFLALGGAAVAGTAGCLGGDSGDAPDGPVATAPVPDGPGQYTYATMGHADAPVVATYIGNWKCPYCARFSTGNFADVVTEYVEPGDLAVQFRALAYIGNQAFLGPDAPRAARAGLAVWHADPDSYWAFHEYVMSNQPSERRQWATTDRLVSMADSAGVSDTEAVRSAVENGDYQAPVRQTARVAASAGVDSTPAFAVGGQMVNPLQTDQLTSAIESAIESA